MEGTTTRKPAGGHAPPDGSRGRPDGGSVTDAPLGNGARAARRRGSSEAEDSSRRELLIDGRTLSIDDVVTVARRPGSVDVRLDPGAASLVERSNQLKWQLLEERQPIYGMTTGFGDSVRRRIGPQKAADLQRNMVRYHLNGVGPRSEPEIVRAAMLIRANCLARGSSGLRTEVIDVLLRCLAADILPLIPELGSVGASGDLVPLCYLAERLSGEVEVLFRGELRPT